MLKKCRSCNSICTTLVKEIKSIPINIWPQKKINYKNFKKLKIYVCKNCGQIQLQKNSKKNLENIYKGKTYNFDNVTQIKNRIKILNKHYNFKNKKLLDIGGGTNPFLKNIKARSKWVCDLKFNDNLENHNINKINGDFLNKQIKENFDFIFLFHTLEHFEDTYKYLNKIHKLLDSNGRLIIEVPNMKYDIKYNPYYIFFHMHITIYYQENLINLLMINGFKKEIIFNNNEVLFISFKKSSSNNFVSKNKYYKNSVDRINLCFNNLIKIDNYFNRKNYENICIYGAGGSTNLLISNSKYLIKNVKYIADKDKKKENLFLTSKGVRISKPISKIFNKILIILVLNNDHIINIPKKYRNKIIKIIDIINEKIKY